jgi:hypothetical protein
MFKLLPLLALVLVLSTGCASFQNAVDRNMLNLSNKSATIRCYSGGVVIYETVTQGKVTDDPESDGFLFNDKNGKFVEVNADCIITY